MRDYAKYKLHWNRKGEDKSEALIQIEVLLPSGKQKWVGTGIYVTADQWDATNRQIINDPFAAHLNNQLAEKVNKIRAHELTLIDAGRVLTAEEVDRAMEKKAPGSFLTFMRSQIEERKGISSGTRYLHLRVADNLEACGIIRTSDLTYINIVKFDNHLKGKLDAQVSVSKQHQVAKHYIRNAANAGLMTYDSNPYLKFKFERGKHKIRVRLDDHDIDKLLAAPAGPVRDLAVFQLHTGVAHRDLERLKMDNIRYDGDDVWLEGLRKKSGELYSVFLLPEAVRIIERCKGGSQLITCPELHKYNRDLKVLGAACGISKMLTSYVLRHTYATWMLRKGVAITTIRDTMGHTDIDTTMIYAKLERQTIKNEMKKAFL